ncbi:5'-AMP-activated protein kinase subunit gamma-1-like isoform X2 [Oncorhynchus nerka]|uniref:5'-AMP-activated protein kinase subunit gamma-1-like isoform X2 n=1 Tax=Oncorhynchus nerka TaxID=8023 RepID=UPI0031B8B2A3
MREQSKNAGNSEANAEMYMKFMKSHCCYETIPTSCKLVIFDTTLQQYFMCGPLIPAVLKHVHVQANSDKSSLSVSTVLTGSNE